MEVDLWNRIDIPRPGVICTTRIPFNSSTESQVTRLMNATEKALTWLRSEVLRTEVRVLYSLLYVLHNGFRQHPPFRAIKQVEQCINRLKDMKLESVLLDLKEMCPTKAQRLVGMRTGQCEVPSQPILEWMCLKVLGACKLMICMAERCSQAFRLAGQHLHWGEFIVMNVVLLSMLSRLWVFSQGIIRSLVPVYEMMIALLQEVSQAKPMPFLSASALPTDLEVFLASAPKLQGDKFAVKGTRRPAMLNRLFKGEARDRKRRQPCLDRTSSRWSDRVDLGSVVSQSRPEITDYLGGFNLKSLLKRPYGINKQLQLEIPREKRASQEVAVVCQKKRFLKKLKAMSALSDVGAHLQEMRDWFRSRKMRRESVRLRLLLLKCQRLKQLEARGLRVNRKLQRLRGETRRALFPGEIQRTKRCHSLHSLWRGLHSRTLLSSNRKFSLKRSRRGRQSQVLAGGRLSPEEEAGESGVMGNEDTDEDGETHNVRPSKSGQDDIDDIFASIGF